MQVTQGNPDGGALASLNGNWVLLRDNASGRFARHFAFSLPTGGLADSIRWQSDTAFTLSFPSFDYNALSPGAPEGVTTANSGGDQVKLTFPVPRTLLRVKISGAQSIDQIEAHRVDGNAVTEDAFAYATHGAAGATPNVVDRQLVLGRKRNGASVPLRTNDIAEVIVRSAAANVRVGIALADLGGEVFYLGPDAGAVLTNPAAASNVGPALAALLQGACDRLTDTLGSGLLPASVSMTLVVESDTPTRAHVSGFALRYRLGRQRFEDLAPKRVFAFAGGSLISRDLALEVPGGTTLWSATLRMTGPFQEQADEAPENADGMNDPPAATQPVVSDLGLEFRVGESAAARIITARAALVQGATLDLVAIAEVSAGRVRFHRDADGQPGEALGETSFGPIAAGVQRVVRVDFDPAVVVSAGPLWIAAQCDNGALLWLTNEPSEVTAGSRVLRRAAGDVQWTAIALASDRGAAASLVTAAAGIDEDLPADASAFHGVRLRLGRRRLRGLAPAQGGTGDNQTRFDIASVLQPLVQSGTAESLVAVSLSLVSSEPGRVTVYPLELEYDP